MAHLKVYLNGTPGLKDGVELDISNPIDLSILSGISGRPGGTGGITSSGCKIIRLCLREDTGFKATGVVINGGVIYPGYSTDNFVLSCVYGPFTTAASINTNRNIVEKTSAISVAQIGETNIGVAVALFATLGMTLSNYLTLSISFIEAEV